MLATCPEGVLLAPCYRCGHRGSQGLQGCPRLALSALTLLMPLLGAARGQAGWGKVGASRWGLGLGPGVLGQR